jgi:hypothetical protein
MKKLWPLILTFLLTPPYAVQAAWAQHEVVTPANVQKYAESALKVVHSDEGKVQITPPATRNNHKGFVLVICKKPRAEDQLNFRMVLSSWKRLQELREKLPPGTEPAHFATLFT